MKRREKQKGEKINKNKGIEERVTKSKQEQEGSTAETER